MLITQQQRKEYEVQLAQGMGKGSGCWADTVRGIVRMVTVDKFCCIQSILDYGCGAGGLGKKLMGEKGLPKGTDFRNYEPGRPELAAPPKPADLVVCTDVLEHVEPDCMKDVIQNIHDVTIKFAFIVICLVPSYKRFLSDGRNVHISMHTPLEWKAKLDSFSWEGIYLPLRKAGKWVGFLYSRCDVDYLT